METYFNVFLISRSCTLYILYLQGRREVLSAAFGLLLTLSFNLESNISHVLGWRREHTTLEFRVAWILCCR